jgi:hypothetical protein
MSMEQYWNDDYQKGKQKKLEEKRIYFHLSALNIIRSHPGLNLRLHNEKPASGNQSYDMEWRVKYCPVLGPILSQIQPSPMFIISQISNPIFSAFSPFTNPYFPRRYPAQILYAFLNLLPSYISRTL